MNPKEIIIKLLAEKRPDIKSVAALERAVGISNATINKWDKAAPSSKNLEKVAKFFMVSTDYLLGKTDDPNPSRKDDAPVDLDRVLSEEEGMVMFDGQPLSDEYKRALLAMLRANRGQ